MPRLKHTLDMLTLMGAVARTGCAVVAEPLVGWVGPSPALSTLTEVTTPWLERVLQRDFPGARLRTVTTLGTSTGTTDRARVGITYAASSAPSVPTSVFVKLAPAGMATRVFGDLMRLGATEVDFYRTIASEVPVLVPRSFDAAIDTRTQRFVLVLEDLVANGASFTDVSRPVTATIARRVVGELGRLHAAFWRSPRFDTDLAWLKTPYRNPTIRHERALCRAALGPGLRRFPALIPDAIRHAAPRILAARDRLDARWARRPLTLIHGDCHSGNLYFVGDGVGFLDWQVTQCGPGLRDVSYFLISSMPTATRLAHQQELLAHYLASLADAGVDAPSFDDAWLEHRLHACHAWIAAIVTAAAATLQIEPIARAAVARANRALIDLDTLGALANLEA